MIPPAYVARAWVCKRLIRSPEPEILNFPEPKNRFQGTNSARLCSVYPSGPVRQPYSHILTRFLAPIDCFKIPALAGRYDNPIPTRFLILYRLL